MINSKANIVVVDDIRANLHLLNNLLSEAGYLVRPIPHGKRVLPAVEKNPPDLILLDILMPDIDGYQVCEQLKAQESTCDIPVIFISALNDTFDKVKAFTIGGVDYITKPFQREEMIARIENQLTIQRQKRILSSVLNSSLDGIIALQSVRNQEGTIVDFQFLIVNPTAAKTLGQPSSSIVGKQLLKDFPEAKEEGLLNEFRQVVENNTNLHKELYYERQTFRGWFQIVAVKLDDGVAITFRDITKRKKIEAVLQRQANLDGLTGVANRRYFDEYLKEQWQHCGNEQQPLSLILCDVDYFKLYNDAYGHQMGDKCLIEVSQTLKKIARRPNDLVARYGGEEFAIILPATNAEGALKIAESLRSTIQQLQTKHKLSQTCEYVTISSGVSSIIPTDRTILEKLIATADKALYEAKNCGRNCVKSLGI